LSLQSVITSRISMHIMESTWLFLESIRWSCWQANFPQRQKRLVEAWAELHQQELAADWEALQDGRRAAPIAPLE
jgi:hypothetical protein